MFSEFLALFNRDLDAFLIDIREDYTESASFGESIRCLLPNTSSSLAEQLVNGRGPELERSLTPVTSATPPNNCDMLLALARKLMTVYKQTERLLSLGLRSNADRTAICKYKERRRHAPELQADACKYMAQLSIIPVPLTLALPSQERTQI